MKRKMATRLLALFIVAVVCFTGCGPGAGTGGSDGTKGADSKNDRGTKSAGGSEEPVVLKLYNQTDDQAIMEAMIERYRQIEPNVTIEPTYIPAGEYPDKILVYLSGGQDMDIIYINTISEYYSYAQKGVLSDLTTGIQENSYDTSVLPPIFQDMKFEEKYYGLPYKRTSWLLFYNKDIFDREGIPYPEQMTWDEFRTLAKKLTRGDGSDKQWGTFFVNWILNYMTVQQGVSLFDDNLEKPLRDSFQLVYDLYYTDESSMSLKEQVATKADWLTSWEQGNIAMYMMGNWLVPLIRPDELAGKSKVNYGVTSLPVPAGVEPGTTFGQGGFLAVPENSTKKQAAMRFVTWAAGPEGNTITAGQGFLPAIVSEDTKSALASFMKTDAYVDVMLDTKLVPEFESRPYMEELRQICAEEGDLYLMQEKDLDSAIASILERRDELLK